MAETDLDWGRGAVLVRHGKRDKRREVGMDAWGWEQLRPWLATRSALPVGALLCVASGPTTGRAWSSSSAGVRRRFAPHQRRHAHAVELARERVPLNVIQRQLGHAHLGVTSTYLQGIDNAEIIDTIRRRPAPVLPASAGLRP